MPWFTVADVGAVLGFSTRVPKGEKADGVRGLREIVRGVEDDDLNVGAILTVLMCMFSWVI